MKTNPKKTKQKKTANSTLPGIQGSIMEWEVQTQPCQADHSNPSSSRTEGAQSQQDEASVSLHFLPCVFAPNARTSTVIICSDDLPLTARERESIEKRETRFDPGANIYKNS